MAENEATFHFSLLSSLFIIILHLYTFIYSVVGRQGTIRITGNREKKIPQGMGGGRGSMGGKVRGHEKGEDT